MYGDVGSKSVDLSQVEEKYSEITRYVIEHVNPDAMRIHNEFFQAASRLNQLYREFLALTSGE